MVRWGINQGLLDFRGAVEVDTKQEELNWLDFVAGGQLYR